MIAAIHQPNYLPWLGYFNKMARSDMFVIFDDVQLVRGKSYVSRNMVKTSSGAQWLTVPVTGKGEMHLIKDTMLAPDRKWQQKHWRTVLLAYSRAPYFDMYKAEFEEIYRHPWDNLCELNITLIKAVRDILDIKTRLVISSELDIQTSGEEKILDIIKRLDADTYITGEGKGSQRYVDENDFVANGIKLVYQQFHHPVYRQQWGEFVPNMSVIDLLFNEGEKSLEILLGASSGTN